MNRIIPEETVVDEAQKIIDAIKEERKRPFSGLAISNIEAVEYLRNRLVSLAQPRVDKAKAMSKAPKNRQVRLIFGDGEHLSGMDHVKKNPGKVFAVIGPFDEHTDKQDLQDMLEVVCRGFNTEPG